MSARIEQAAVRVIDGQLLLRVVDSNGRTVEGAHDLALALQLGVALQDAAHAAARQHLRSAAA